MVGLGCWWWVLEQCCRWRPTPLRPRRRLMALGRGARRFYKRRPRGGPSPCARPAPRGPSPRSLGSKRQAGVCRRAAALQAGRAAGGPCLGAGLALGGCGRAARPPHHCSGPGTKSPDPRQPEPLVRGPSRAPTPPRTHQKAPKHGPPRQRPTPPDPWTAPAHTDWLTYILALCNDCRNHRPSPSLPADMIQVSRECRITNCGWALSFVPRNA